MYFFGTAIMSLLLGATACNNIEDDAPGMDNRMRVSVINNVPQSRAIITGTTLAANDIIGVTLLNAEGANYDGIEYSNLQYKFDDADWAVVAPDTDPLLSATAGKAIAYYPYGETVDYTAMTIETDAQIDYLYSNWETVNNSDPKADFTMNHALSAIRVILKKSTDYKAVAEATKIVAKSTAFVESAKINAGAAENKYSEWSTGEADVEVDVVTKEGGETGGQILDDGTTNYTDILVVPAEAAGTSVVFTVTIKDENDAPKNYTVEAPFTTAMAPGTIYQFTLTLDATGFVVNSVSVTPWGDPVEVPGDNSLTPVVTP